jgi:hypothetical protein
MSQGCTNWLSEDAAKKLEEGGDIPIGSHYYYTDAITNEKMVEFHVDASKKLLLLGTVHDDFGCDLKKCTVSDRTQATNLVWT